MATFARLFVIECIKLRRSSALRFIIVLPLVFLALDFLFFRRPLLSLEQMRPEGHGILVALPIRTIAAVWAGIFHPLLLALLPALLMRPEHRGKLWKHLYSQPVSPGKLFVVKALLLLVLVLAVFGLLEIGLWLEGGFLGRLKPMLAVPFPWLETAKVLGWLFLGSLPLLALYLWLSQRVDHGAVPVAFGLIGLVLCISLSRGEMNPPWKRDFIPWVLPYVCAQRAVERHDARTNVHLAAQAYRLTEIEDPDTVKMIKEGLGERLIPWVFPPPTPLWQLVAFSLAAGAGLTFLGVMDSRSKRG